MAHGSLEGHTRCLDEIRGIRQQLGRPVAVLADLAGPKIRLGQLPQDPTTCAVGAQFDLVRGLTASDPHQLVTTYPLLVDELAVGDRVMLADGTVGLEVVDKQPDRARCVVVAGGMIRSRQGVNLPGVKLSVPALTEEDQRHAAWAARQEVDFVGLSFVRSPADVRQLQDLLGQHGSAAHVIAKIEKPEALEQLDQIVAAAHGVMVARGDLGVEIDVAEMAVAQKRIIAACSRAGKPVIVATQMLDSMQHARQPTRAEVTDVANAILDGADACMLSGETAIGQFPRESVQMMNRVMLASEQLLRDCPARPPGTSAGGDVHPITAAVVAGAAEIARRLDARAVVIATRSGATALAQAKQRGFIPTVAVSDCPQTLRRMCLYWGIMPLPGAHAQLGPDLVRFVVDLGRADGSLRPGDRLVVVAGTGMEPGTHNTLTVHEVP
jgi:pyruvate kinase